MIIQNPEQNQKPEKEIPRSIKRNMKPHENGEVGAEKETDKRKGLVAETKGRKNEEVDDSEQNCCHPVECSGHKKQEARIDKTYSRL